MSVVVFVIVTVVTFMVKLVETGLSLPVIHF